MIFDLLLESLFDTSTITTSWPWWPQLGYLRLVTYLGAFWVLKLNGRGLSGNLGNPEIDHFLFLFACPRHRFTLEAWTIYRFKRFQKLIFIEN
jgi:hypothetical protein